MRRIVLAAFALSVLSACQTATTELTEEQKIEIASEIRQAVAECWNAAEEVDTERWMSCFSAELEAEYIDQPAVFVNRINIHRTVNDVRGVWEPAFEVRSAHDIVTENEDVVVLGEDAALHVYEGTFNISDTLGTTSEYYPYTVSTVWVRKTGQWKILHLHQSWNMDS